MRPFLLASSSPRRKALLEQLGLSFEVAPPEIDESRLPGEAPQDYVRRLAAEKALAVAQPGRLSLGSDTSVVLGGDLLGKPADQAEAAQTLRRLSGQRHAVLSGVATVDPGGAVRGTVVETLVRFRPLSDAEIAWYVATPEPYDKAGAYAIQGLAGCFVEAIEGSHSNVIGLPLAETLALLSAAGLALPWAEEAA